MRRNNRRRHRGRNHLIPDMIGSIRITAPVELQMFDIDITDGDTLIDGDSDSAFASNVTGCTKQMRGPTTTAAQATTPNDSGLLRREDMSSHPLGAAHSKQKNSPRVARDKTDGDYSKLGYHMARRSVGSKGKVKGHRWDEW